MSDRSRTPLPLSLLLIALIAALGGVLLLWTRASRENDEARRALNRSRARTAEAERRFTDEKEARIEAQRRVEGFARGPTEADIRELESRLAATAAELDAHEVELEGNMRTIEALSAELEQAKKVRAPRSDTLVEMVHLEQAQQRADELRRQLAEAERRIAERTRELELALSRADAAEELIKEREARPEPVAGPETTAAPAGDLERRLLDELRELLTKGGAASAIVHRLGDSEITRDLLTTFLDDEALASRALLALASLESVTPDWLLARIAAGGTASDQAASEALTRSFGADAKERLPRAAAHESPRVRRACVLMAAARPDRAGAEMLLGLAGDGDSGVAELAAKSLTAPRMLRLAIPPAIAGIAAGTVKEPEALARALLHPSLARQTLPRLADAALTAPPVRKTLADLIDADDRPRPLSGAAACGELLPLGWREGKSEWLRRLGRMVGITLEDEVALRRALVSDHAVAVAGGNALTASEVGDDAALTARSDGLVAGGAADELAAGIEALAAAGASPRLIARTLVRISRDAGRVDVAAVLLARRGDPRTVSTLMGLFDRVEPDVVVEAAHAVARLGHPAGVARLGDVMRSNDLQRGAALQRLVQLGTPAALETARGVLETGDAAAAVLLVDLHDKADLRLDAASVDRIMETYRLEDDAATRVLLHAEKIHHEDTRAHVGERLLADRIRSKTAVLRYLASPPDPELMPLFAAQLSDADADVRVAAVTIIGRLGPAPVLDELLALVNDAEPRVRRALAAVLGTVRGPASRGALVVLAKDEEWYVREAAVGALPGQANGRLLIPTLKGRLSDDVVEVRNAARMALCRLGVADHVEELFDDLENTHLANRTRAFLEKTFERKLSDAAAWRGWWTTHGRIEFEERNR